jgi:hypothetical protein
MKMVDALVTLTRTVCLLVPATVVDAAPVKTNSIKITTYRRRTLCISRSMSA